jgi:hypothetical protein
VAEFRGHLRERGRRADGLLFVAVSLNRARIVGHAALQSEAGQTLVLFLALGGGVINAWLFLTR